LDIQNRKDLMNQVSGMEAILINLKEAFQALCVIIIDMETGLNEIRRKQEEYNKEGGSNETRRSWNQF